MCSDLFADGNDFSWTTIEKNRNLYYQQQLAEKVSDQATGIVSLLTSALNIHINIGQNFTINTSSVFMSLETLSVESFSKKVIQPVGSAQIHLLSNLYSNHSTISLRVCFIDFSLIFYTRIVIGSHATISSSGSF